MVRLSLLARELRIIGDTSKHHAKALKYSTRKTFAGFKDVSSTSRQLCNSKAALATEEKGSHQR